MWGAQSSGLIIGKSILELYKILGETEGGFFLLCKCRVSTMWRTLFHWIPLLLFYLINYINFFLFQIYYSIKFFFFYSLPSLFIILSLHLYILSNHVLSHLFPLLICFFFFFIFNPCTFFFFFRFFFFFTFLSFHFLSH